MITKLLVECIGPLLHGLISQQQTGFVPGRLILENISLVWLISEWLSHLCLVALCLMLDYKKTFDRVDHGYIWEAMAKLGLGSSFIRLVRGLVEGTSSKIHANRLFFDEIPVSWGVRQGCPLLPLLFAIAS